MLDNSIEEIMKPYFDKVEEINDTEKYEKEINSNNIEKNSIQLRLDRLMENKEKEIKEYISDSITSMPDFYAVYGASIKKDLEQAYNDKEEELKLQMSDIDKKNEEISKELGEKAKYKNVDLREIVELKEETRKKIIAKRNELSLRLEEKNIEYASAMLNIRKYNIEYDDNHNPIQTEELQELFNNGRKITDEINNIRASLKNIDEYLKLMELTKEESASVLRSMAPFEEQEYNRRKGIENNIDKVVENKEDKQEDNQEEELPEIQIPDEIESLKVEIPEDVGDKTLVANDIIDINDPLKGKAELNDNEVIVDNYQELIKLIYNDVIDLAGNISSVKLNEGKGKLSETERYFSSKVDKDKDYIIESSIDLMGKSEDEQPIELPCGEYINKTDIKNALKEYYNKNKGKTYILNSINKELKLSKQALRKIKNKLKRCSTIKLIADKKLSEYDILRVFGKERADEYTKEAARKTEIGTTSEGTRLQTGEYGNRNEIVYSFKNLFKTNESVWLKKIASKIKNMRTSESNIKKEEFEYPKFQVKDEEYEAQSVKTR